VRRANAVSGGGRLIVGWQDDLFGFRQGAWWVDGHQEVVVGPFGPVGEALATNHDGSIVVGMNCDPATLSAWKWTAATGVACVADADGPTDHAHIGMMLSTSPT
jgi:hypothetical protein